MTDREKVIRALENCNARPKCKDCPWEPCEEFDCKHSDYPDGLIQQAIAMLKAQEPPTDTSISSAIECLLHPQDADDSDMAQAIDTAVRAMRLLKAQEPIVPIRCSAHAQGADDVWYECGKCHKFLGVSRYSKQFCANCGRAVKWDG